MKRDAAPLANPSTGWQGESAGPVTSASAAPELAHIPIPAGAEEQAMETELYVSKDNLMSAAREDLKIFMRDNLGDIIDTAVDKTFESLTNSINKVEARHAQHARQIPKVKNEVSGRSAKINALEASIHRLTATLSPTSFRRWPHTSRTGAGTRLSSSRDQMRSPSSRNSGRSRSPMTYQWRRRLVDSGLVGL